MSDPMLNYQKCPSCGFQYSSEHEGSSSEQGAAWREHCQANSERIPVSSEHYSIRD